jgi:Protein of unknown function (DUF4239)
MFQSIVNTVPIGVLIVIVVALVVGMTLVGVWLVRRAVPLTTEGFDAEVSSQMLGVVASIFGLLLAFVVVLAFQGYDDAGASARQEADAISQIVRDSRAFPPTDQANVSAASGAYVRAVVEDEWAQLRDGHSSARASTAIDNLYLAIQRVQPATAAASVFYQDAVGRLNDVLSARRARLADANGSLSAPIVGLVILGSLVILGYATLVGSRSPAFHAISAGALALVLGFSVVILMAYNYPYSGSLAIDPAPFQSGVLARYF